MLRDTTDRKRRFLQKDFGAIFLSFACSRCIRRDGDRTDVSLTCLFVLTLTCTSTRGLRCAQAYFQVPECAVAYLHLRM